MQFPPLSTEPQIFTVTDLARTSQVNPYLIESLGLAIAMTELSIDPIGIVRKSRRDRPLAMVRAQIGSTVWTVTIDTLHRALNIAAAELRAAIDLSWERRTHRRFNMLALESAAISAGLKAALESAAA